MVARPPLVSTGEVLDGKYVVERIIGEGGMGLVVAASHVVLKTRVAIKILLPDVTGDPEIVERFHREARSAVRIKSPHAARVHDVGQLPDGTPYMVMDLLAGRDLDALLSARGAIPPTEAVGYLLQALSALQAAHDLGIIHRDLKPANLFLADQPSGPPVVKVLDFGIARDFHEGNESRLTRTRAVMGSPTYMSPEQAREARLADVRSDVWSAGVCLYELLTGRAPFEGASLADLFVQVLQVAPVSPSTLRPDIPLGLSDVVLGCLEKDPARRYQSAALLALALTPWASQSTWPADGLSRTMEMTRPSYVPADLARVVAPSRTMVTPPSSVRSLAAPPPPSTSSSAGTIIVVVVLVAAMIGGGAIFKMRPKHPPAADVVPPTSAQASVSSAIDVPPSDSTTAPRPPATGAGEPDAATPPSTTSASRPSPGKVGGKLATHSATPSPAPLPPASVAPPPPVPPPPKPEFDPKKGF